MTRQVVFHSLAREEYDLAVDWYENSRPGLGMRFSMAVDETLTRVTAHPAQFRIVRGRIRRVVLNQFPFTIHFLEEPDRIVVLAVYHASRDPRKLKGRTSG